VGGSFFDDVPADGDLYILAHVLHDWDDAEAVKILRNCHRAGRPGHALVVVEMLLPDGPGDWLPFLLDLHMLVTNGGRERTAGDFRALLDKAGYRVGQITGLPGGQNILLAWG
jgi:SAM-dependent methyltransferase